MIREYIYFVDDNPNGTSGMTEEEVVRCEHCKWSDWYTAKHVYISAPVCYCTRTGRGGYTSNDYCSHGERREE